MPRKPHTYHFIYKTTNVLNENFYIGMHSTSNLNDGYIGSGTKLRRAIRKYGVENFKFEILEWLPDRDALKTRETELVNLEMIRNPLCMNLRTGGTGDPETNYGSKRSDETRRKMSEWKRTPEMKEKISKKMLGKRKSESTKENMRKSKLGKKQSDIMIAKRFEKVKCPHCEAIMSKVQISRWHLDNCKNKL